MNSVLDFTNNGIHEQWKIRTVVYAYTRQVNLRESGCPAEKTFSRTADTAISGSCVHKSSVKGSRQITTASPLTPWIYGILDFCNVRVHRVTGKKLKSHSPQYDSSYLRGRRKGERGKTRKINIRRQNSGVRSQNKSVKNFYYILMGIALLYPSYRLIIDAL